MSVTAPPSQSKRKPGQALGIAALALTFGWLVSLSVGWLAVITYASITNPALSFDTGLHALTTRIPQSIAFFFVHVVQGQMQLGPMSWAWHVWTLNHKTWYHIYIAVALGLEAIAVLWALAAGFKKSNGIIHVGGLRRSDDVTESLAIAAKAFNKIKKAARGVMLHPAAGCISILSETRHFLYVGMSGAGKTQALKNPMFSAYERGDQMVIYDMKGDFSRVFSVDDYRSGRVVMLCPWDRRSKYHHALNRDISELADGDLVAKTLLPGDLNASVEYWGKAAEDVLGGILDCLWETMHGKWSWADFRDMFKVAEGGKLAGKPVVLMKAIADFRFGAQIHTGAPEQAAGVVGNIRADIRGIDKVAKYWPRRTGGFSIKSWIKGAEHTETQVLILKGSTTKTWYVPAISAQIALALSQAMDLPEGDAKLWFFLDELPQLPRIINLKDAMLTLRSKGVRMVLGIQNGAALEQIYGEADTQTIVSQCATKVFGQASGKSAAWNSEWFSGAEEERRQDTVQANQSASGDAMGTLFDPLTQASTSYQRQEVKAVPDWCFEALPDGKQPGWLASLLGAKGGPTMYVKTPDVPGYVLKMKFEYEKMPENSAHEYLRDHKTVKGDPVLHHTFFISKLHEYLNDDEDDDEPETPVEITGEPAGGTEQDQAPKTESETHEPPEQAAEAEAVDDIMSWGAAATTTDTGSGVEDSAENILEGVASHVADAIAPGVGALMDVMDNLAMGPGTGRQTRRTTAHHNDKAKRGRR
ncbi:type IV secretion system DNA-binding domain-containing protein [Mariprofundus ferrooxydans]|uniref:type IV secretion system DNA-binding domain-containing protein n=1 Tax=Mariprofundus ferrooxydans TaxID=314344 RepID=UPI0014311D90|nr:type IV secretion system DNA-binding domain-containing protein [Mariprofundus ferrooxydans]